MMHWTTNRVNPAVAARTAMPGMTRQATATAPIGSRGAQFRAAEMQRGAPAQRGAEKAADDDPDDEKDDDRETLFARGEDDDDDGADDGNTSPDDDPGDDMKPNGQTGDNTEDEDTDPK